MVLLLYWKSFLYFLLYQVLRDTPKARREIELHWRASSHRHIVNLVDVYENMQSNSKCLMVVMEW